MGLFYYRHRITSYDLDTKDLSLLQHGVYRRLMDAYMANSGPIKADPGALFRCVSAISPDEQEAVRIVVDRYFRREGELLRHPTCDDEIVWAIAQSEGQAAKANKRWGNRAGADAAASTAAHAAARAGAMPVKSKEDLKASPPVSPPPARRSARPPSDTTVGEENYTPSFTRFWLTYPASHRGSKWPAFQKWQQLKLESVEAKLIADVEKRRTSHRGWLEGFIPHASTYLNERQWDGEIDTSPPRVRAGPGNRHVTESTNHTVAAEWAEGTKDTEDPE